MLASRYSAHHALSHFPIWVMILLLVFTTAQGRTWPRFVSKQNYHDDIDKIYSTSSFGTGSVKKLAETKRNSSSFASKINSSSHSHLHSDDTGDYNNFNGSISKGTNASTVDSTHIIGPFQMGKDVNASVYTIMCPSTSPLRNKFQVQHMCGLYVHCMTEKKDFVILGCNKNRSHGKNWGYFDEETGKCETSDESCVDDEILKAYNTQTTPAEILEHIVAKMQNKYSARLEDTLTSRNGFPETDLHTVDEGSHSSNSSFPSAKVQRSANVEIEALCKSQTSTPHGLHPHPYLCEKYIQCGATPDTVFIKSCGPGTVFNRKTLNCDWPYNVDGCNHQSPNGEKRERRKRDARKTIRLCETTGNEEDAVVPDPDNCNKYHVCSSAGNVYTTLTCNQGTLFNPLSSVCDFADSVDCTSRKNDFGTYGCDASDAYIAPHPDHCNKFVECDHGILAIKSCPPGTLYEREKQQCDHAYKVKCRKPISLENDIAVNYVRRRKRRNTNPLNLACDFNYIAPHPNNCHQFVECENRRIYIKNCGPGTAFNGLLGQCDWPYNVRQPDPNDCTRFRQCVRTHYQRRSCPQNQYFDVNLNRCVFGDPNRIRQCSVRFVPTTTTERFPTTRNYDFGTPPPS